MPPLHRARLRRDPLLGPEASLNRARFAPTTLSPFERNPVARNTHTHAQYTCTYIYVAALCSSDKTMRDLARSPFFATIVRVVLITCDAQYGRDKFSP